MATDQGSRDEELRAQLTAILRANRELGPGYERIGVDQLMDVIKANRGGQPREPRRRPAERAARPAPAASGGRGWGAPWWVWALAVVAAIRWGPSLLRASGLGSLSWIPAVLAIVVFVQLLRVVIRWGRRLEDSWGGEPRIRTRPWC